MPYQINRNADMDILHVEHPWEACNTDDAENMGTVDDETAAALIAIGEAVRCQHCKPLAEKQSSVE